MTRKKVPQPADSQLRKTLSGPDWWRSLEELADTEEFRAYLQREFPVQASEWLQCSRRDFLSIMGASFILAGLNGCDLHQPAEDIVPAVHQVNQNHSEGPLFFNTAIELSGSVLGLTVESQMGRPIKIEGNPQHPISRGATNVFAQAATLNLYDPDRLQNFHRNQKLVAQNSWTRELQALRSHFDETNGAGLRILTQTSTSPTQLRLLHRVVARWPEARWYCYEPVNDDQRRSGTALALGTEAATLQPVHDLKAADVILSVDDDFLQARDQPLHQIREFAERRRIAGREEPSRAFKPNRLYALATAPTLTAAKADHALRTDPGTIVSLLTSIARELGVEFLNEQDQQRVDQRAPARSTRTAVWLKRVVSDLKKAGANCLVTAGREQPPLVHALVHVLNSQLKNDGVTTHFYPSMQNRPDTGVSDTDMLRALTDEMQSGQVKDLFILGGNPVFDAPADIPFSAALNEVPRSYALTSVPTETSQRCLWSIPDRHFLERWGDVRSVEGTASIVQPLISPLYSGISALELLGILVEESDQGYQLVRETWSDQLGREPAAEAWSQALAEGLIPGTALQPVSPALADSVSRQISAAMKEYVEEFQADPNRLTLSFRPDPAIWDGRFINNGWLQELPKPLSTLTWDNTAWLSVGDAERRDLKNGDLIIISDGEQECTLPVWIMPGQPDGCITTTLGYGRSVTGRVGSKTGFNIYPMRTSLQMWFRPAVMVTKTQKRYSLAATQLHHLMEGKHLVRSGTWSEYQNNPERPEFAHPPSPLPESSFYEDWPYEGHRWGMTIDLTACVGCAACMVACQSENNIPVVGKQQVILNREMHWIRVDTYYEGAEADPSQTLSQPVPCMHCEDAPCEVVCPVAATTHSEEGLNQMVYNRCVGTRYCSNNCPYKVRRFNFLDFSEKAFEDPSLHLLTNPDVTVRSRGVMEKCTYCVQRIEENKIRAQREDRALHDGEIVTACQSACPAQAIQFGDLNLPGSRVKEGREHALNYSLLEELNTKPRTTYLAEVTNPHPGDDS
ncbi:4Fe-4S dicluster domain-containing protein [Gimesia chilikensis]|uniref:TAT-variant-translocated molybdopterin oxidoreductase n=1 Tax=Gimesia chilikensis TaxID=2605989 RepID=UPI0011EF33D8|nr:TAT-variant-translocated molybdopterin oxidoreductase [Gimesia chilikensis]KAA0131557.1 4Fe-4S dicluster domain-containing protein [Gimesia chilikensis]